jgi:hypothetical protein
MVSFKKQVGSFSLPLHVDGAISVKIIDHFFHLIISGDAIGLTSRPCVPTYMSSHPNVGDILLESGAKHGGGLESNFPLHISSFSDARHNASVSIEIPSNKVPRKMMGNLFSGRELKDEGFGRDTSQTNQVLCHAFVGKSYTNRLTAFSGPPCYLCGVGPKVYQRFLRAKQVSQPNDHILVFDGQREVDGMLPRTRYTDISVSVQEPQPISLLLGVDRAKEGVIVNVMNRRFDDHPHFA